MTRRLGVAGAGSSDGSASRGAAACRQDWAARGSVIQRALESLGADRAADLVEQLHHRDDAWDAAFAHSWRETRRAAGG